jgi:pimeloyl-ACP methyl ester carboxylesterase
MLRWQHQTISLSRGNIMNTEQSLSTPRRRGCLFYVKRVIKWMGITFFALIFLGVAYQAVAAEIDRRTFAPPGQMVDVDGHQMHLYCTGEGSPTTPTVIMEAGAYSFSPEWVWVQRQLESTYRVCSYDRAGNGWSEGVDGARDGLTIVHELHNLLEVADIPAPYVIVGHSLGGVLAPIFASQYPNEVVGLVLVDSAIPRIWTEVSQFDDYKSQNQTAYWLMSGLTRLSVLRLILPPEFQSYGYPPEVTAQLTAFKATSQGVDTWDSEVRLAQWDLSHQLQAASDLGDLPVVVMWASHPEITAPEDRTLLEGIWALMPILSSNSVIRIVDGANHGSIIGNEQYAQQVTDATLDVIHAAQTGGALGE